MFLSVFNAYRDSIVSTVNVGQGEINSVMPWTAYSGMTDEDLCAIYHYLMTLKPDENAIKNSTIIDSTT